MPGLILKWVVADWALLLSLLVGVAAVTTVSALAPVYLSSLEHLAFSTSLVRSSARPWAWTSSPHRS